MTLLENRIEQNGDSLRSTAPVKYGHVLPQTYRKKGKASLFTFLLLCSVLRVDPLNAQTNYTISTLSGAASTLKGYTGDGGPAAQARLNEPGGLAWAPDGTLFIADTGNQVIRTIDSSGIIRTVEIELKGTPVTVARRRKRSFSSLTELPWIREAISTLPTR